MGWVQEFPQQQCIQNAKGLINETFFNGLGDVVVVLDGVRWHLRHF